MFHVIRASAEDETYTIKPYKFFESAFIEYQYQFNHDEIGETLLLIEVGDDQPFVIKPEIGLIELHENIKVHDMFLREFKIELIK